MTITAHRSNAEPIRVLRKRHRYFVSMPGEKRLVLTRSQAVALHGELQLIEDLHFEWIGKAFDLAISDGEGPVEQDPLYATSIFEHGHSGDDLQMLQAWLADRLYGTMFQDDNPYYGHVTFLKRIRKDSLSWMDKSDAESEAQGSN